jgi:hypothetical protein
MEWTLWNSIPFAQRSHLPSHPGIYIVVDVEEEVWYVGKSINLNARWNGKAHHRYKQLNRTNNKKIYRIYWQIFSVSQLSEKEQYYINLLRPHLNYSRVKKYARRAIQPNEEISRLLRVLNSKTLLFPDMRSVVLGFYTEIDEDEEGIAQEYICIVIVVTINDYDRVILKSYDKSFSRKGMSLKDYWKTYESDFGLDDSQVTHISIPVFIIENIVYEFVCYSSLIDKLTDCTSSLHIVEVAKRNVLAFKDTSILSSLIIDDKYFDLNSQDYLQYRLSELSPIECLKTDFLIDL